MLARTTRGQVTDLIYRGHIAIANTRGELVYHQGDPNTLVFARSSTKAFQALVALESGAVDHYRINDKELAVICGSHGGTKDHVDTVEAILKKAGLSESYLRCGSHYPLDKAARRALQAQGLKPGPLHNNCSGKHAGALIASKFLKEDLDNYLACDHPHQKRTLELLEDFTDWKAEDFQLAIDGCGLPVQAAPIKNWARAFARLGDESYFDKKRADGIRRIKKAIKDYPEMISSSSMLDTRLIRATSRLIPKIGAGAFYAIALEEEGLGIVIKIEGGQENILPPLIGEILDFLHIPLDRESLKDLLEPKIYNHAKNLVGETFIELELQSK